jgi:hypothetical protein
MAAPFEWVHAGYFSAVRAPHGEGLTLISSLDHPLILPNVYVMDT